MLTSSIARPDLPQTDRWERASPTSFGAVLIAADMTRFRLWGPGLRSATLEVQDLGDVSLASLGDGWFEADVQTGVGTRYRYRMDTGANVVTAPDPASRAQDGDVHGWSVVVDHTAFEWRCADWRGRPWEEAVILEVHPGIYGGFTGVQRQLAAWAELGITAIELMPVADFPGSRNWGYDGTLIYAPDETYGTPDDLRALVDATHQQGMMIFLDVVYNHFGPDGNYLGNAAPLTFRDDIPTAWGSSIDFRGPQVRSFFTGSAVQWIEQYRFDGLRFDAVHAIADPDWLDEVAVTIRARIGDSRHVHLVVEHDGNVASHLARKPHLFDAQWNDDAHHVLHVLLTGETHGYYQDFDEKPAELLARTLAEGYVYQGQPSKNRNGEPRGTPSAHLPPTAFVNFLQNHDQIGNRPLGERLTSLVPDTDRLRAAVTLLLLAPQIPLLFMGDECGSRSPFLYFTDHHEELAVLVREGRRNEFKHFAEFVDPKDRDKIPDPNADSTFAQSVPREGPDAKAWHDLYKELLRLRCKFIAPRLLGAATLDASATGNHSVAARWTMGDGTILSIFANLGDEAVALPAAEGKVVFEFSGGAAQVEPGRLCRGTVVRLVSNA